MDQRDDAVDDLPHVVGRNIGGHTHGNAAGAVDEQVRHAAGQHAGFLLGLVKVRHEIHGILFDIAHEVHAHLAHAGLSVTVGGRGVAVHRTEVSLSLHKRVPHGEILRQTHHRVIYGCVAVGMVRAQHRADFLVG